MTDILMNRYSVDDNLYKHIDLDVDLSCDEQNTLNKCIIYMLSDISNNNEKYLYVGQTNVDPKSRIKKHLKNLKFTHLYIMQLNTNLRSEVNAAEQQAINRFTPILQGFFTDFEKHNYSQVPVTYEFILKWSNLNNKSKRPGRPRTKEDSKPVYVQIPIRILNELENLYSEQKEVELNKTKLIISLLEKYLEDNR